MQVKPLTSLIIEPTNTCNLRCTFCFVTEGMTRKEGFMDFGLFKKVIDDCPRPRTSLHAQLGRTSVAQRNF